jgi:hypothetical protein
MRQKEKKIIDPDLINEKIVWYDSIEDIPSFTVVF